MSTDAVKEKLKDKLDAAIYILHQLTRTRFLTQPEAVAKKEYDKAMANYRDIINRAGGPSTEANAEEVARGFHITPAERDFIKTQGAR